MGRVRSANTAMQKVMRCLLSRPAKRGRVTS